MTITGDGLETRPATGTDDEPPLRRRTIPVREPQAATSIVPAGMLAVRPAATASVRAALSATQGTLALTLPWESPSALPVGGSPVLLDVTGLDIRPGADPDQPWATGLAGVEGAARPVAVLPDPQEWASRFAQAAVEVAMGLRPAAQLIRWTSLEVHEALVRRGSLVARAGRRAGLPAPKPHLRALLVCSPVPGVCEVAAVVADAERVRAIAFRMEGIQGRWRVTVFEIG